MGTTSAAETTSAPEPSEPTTSKAAGVEGSSETFLATGGEASRCAAGMQVAKDTRSNSAAAFRARESSRIAHTLMERMGKATLAAIVVASVEKRPPAKYGAW